jgi:hypothetical protein
LLAGRFEQLSRSACSTKPLVTPLYEAAVMLDLHQPGESRWQACSLVITKKQQTSGGYIIIFKKGKAF